MKNECIIETGNGSGIKSFIFGGTYKLGKEKFARTTELPNEAKQYRNERAAIRVGKRLLKTCENIKWFSVQNAEDH